MAPIDAYLDELLAPAPMAAAVAGANAPHVDATADAAACNDGIAPGEPASLQADASASDAPAASAIAIDLSLLAEIESDSALTGAMTVASQSATDVRVDAPSPVVAALCDAMPAPANASHDATIAPPLRMPAPAPSPARAVPSLASFMAAEPIAPIPRTATAPSGRARTATGGNRWLRVCVGTDSYAFELLRVQEVVRVAPVVAMRGAAHSVLGVMNLRGRIVPVFDLGLWLDVGAVRVDDRARVVVIERDDELIGVLVTCVDDVVSLEREHVEPPLMTADPGATLGVARVTNAPTVLLDTDALFD